MKLKIISAYNEKFKEISDLSFPTVESFCIKKSFDCERFLVEDFDKPTAWFKIKALIKEVESKKHDYILWIDADAIILNQNFDIKQILDKSKSLYISRDFNNLNSGVMLLKCDEFSIALLKEVWRLSNEYLTHIWWEQAAIIKLFEIDFENVNKKTKIVEQSIFNAYETSYYGINKTGQINNDSFICHFPSLGMGTRIQLIKKYI